MRRDITPCQSITNGLKLNIRQFLILNPLCHFCFSEYLIDLFSSSSLLTSCGVFPVPPSFKSILTPPSSHGPRAFTKPLSQIPTLPVTIAYPLHVLRPLFIQSRLLRYFPEEGHFSTLEKNFATPLEDRINLKQL